MRRARADGRVVDDHLAPVVVESDDHDVVVAVAARRERHHEGASLGQVLAQHGSVARERDRDHPAAAGELREPRAADPSELRLDQLGRDRVLRDVLAVVLQHHRERGRAAGVLLLRDERHLQRDDGREKHTAQHALERIKRRAGVASAVSHGKRTAPGRGTPPDCPLRRTTGGPRLAVRRADPA